MRRNKNGDAVPSGHLDHDSPEAVTGGEYQTTRVGDLWDTSPYNTDYPVECVSTEVFVKNMGELIETLEG